MYHIQQLWLLASCLVSVAVGAAFTIGGGNAEKPPLWHLRLFINLFTRWFGTTTNVQRVLH